MTAMFLQDASKQHQAKQTQIKQHQTLFWGKTIAPITHTTLIPRSDIATALIPNVSVVSSVMGDCLQLSFFVEKKSWLHLSPLAANQFTQADFLWQADCLECFVEFDNQPSYYEINVAPNGNYAIYHFDDYRTPNCMPPRRGKGSILAVEGCFDDEIYWVRHWAFKFDHTQTISKIHPTAILYHHNTPIFYAHQHANPPDFHDKTYWQDWAHKTS